MQADEAGREQAAKEKGYAFLPFFEQHFAPVLAEREQGFRVMFELLEARYREHDTPALIVETGSLRLPGNWAGDGQSTILWAEFAGVYPCEVHTVDLDPAAGETVRKHCGGRVHVHTGDSVAFLYELANRPEPPQIDLLYLDSYDFDARDPFPSAFHHVKELITVRPCLRKGSIVAIDDNVLLPDGSRSGKGYLAIDWFNQVGVPCVHQGHQFIWQF